ncbi:MAG: carotenoid biosynthesis protein, partial [Bacteroidota bacterium]
ILLNIDQHRTLVSIALVWLFIASAMIGIQFGYVEWFIPKTPLNLLLGAALLFWNLPMANPRTISLWAFAFTIGLGMEIIGVHTGAIFGTYYYGDNLGIKFLGVPILIGVNWAVLTFITAAISQHVTRSYPTSAIMAAGLMVGLDILLEVLAGPFDFWYWADDIVPFQNYLAWFLIALFLQLIVQYFIKIRDHRYALHLFASQVVFFGFCVVMIG